MLRTVATGVALTRRQRPRRTGLSVLVGLTGALLLAPARAALWTLDHNLESRLQADDNPNLSPRPGSLAPTLTVAGTLAAAHQTETRSTQLDAAAAAWWAASGSAQRRIDARLGLSQTWRQATEEWRLSAQAQQETTFDNGLLNTATAPVTATATGADFGLGRGQRRSLGASAGWTLALGERLSLQTQAQAGGTQYGRELRGATDFRTTSASAGLSWRSSERNTWSLQLGHSRFATRPDARSSSNSLSLTAGANRALSETSSASISLGGYQSQRESSQNISICPLPVEFCTQGLVRPVVVQLRGSSRDSGLQYAATYNAQWGERTAVKLAAERQQTPSGGATVVRSERFTASLEHVLSDRAGLDASYATVRSRYPTLASTPQPRLQVLMAGVAHRFSERLSLRGGLQWTRSSEASSGLSARSHQVYLTLRLDGPRLHATR